MKDKVQAEYSSFLVFRLIALDRKSILLLML
jgi:hypothetical protein